MSKQLRIAFVNQKGGVGKSTLACLCASALKAAGVSVVIDDLDPQGSSAYFAKHIGGIPTLEEGPDSAVVIVDSPGHLDMSTPASRLKFSGIVGSCDRIVIVTELSMLGLRSAQATIKLVEEFKTNDAKALVVFNKIRIGTMTGNQDTKALATQLGCPSTKADLPLRSAYEIFTSLGWRAVTGPERDLVNKIAAEIIK